MRLGTLLLLPYAFMLCKAWMHIWWLRFCIWHDMRKMDALLAQNSALREEFDALLAAVEVAQKQSKALLAAVEVARKQRDESEASSQAEADFTLGAQEEPQINAPKTEDDATLKEPVMNASLKEQENAFRA